MAVTTPQGPKGLYPDQTFLAREVVPDALIYQLSTVAGNIEGDEPAIRVPFVAEDMTVGFVAEGAAITPADPDLDEITVNTGKLALLVKQSNEAATYADASTLVADTMSKSLTVKANTALLGNAADPTGLLKVTGIGSITDPVSSNLDPIADALTSVEVAGGTPTGIVVDPASWGVLREMKAATDSNLPLLGAPADQADRRLFGVPVLVDAAMPAGTGLVVDKTQIISAVGQIKLATSVDAYFGDDSLARRVTWRIGWNVVRPTRLATFTVTVSGS